MTFFNSILERLTGTGGTVDLIIAIIFGWLCLCWLTGGIITAARRRKERH